MRLEDFENQIYMVVGKIHYQSTLRHYVPEKLHKLLFSCCEDNIYTDEDGTEYINYEQAWEDFTKEIMKRLMEIL
jgi:hypothetical protein